jgi:site-specific DNA-cytosine methylase
MQIPTKSPGHTDIISPGLMSRGGHQPTSHFNLTRAAWDLPCPTITATGAQGRGGIHHPEENRGFTIAELKRLSGLPDDFRLSGTFAQKAERIGRMVQLAMTKAIAESIYKKALKPAAENSGGAAITLEIPV